MMMQYLSLKKNLIAVFIVITVAYAGVSHAHGGGATLGFESSFTGVAFITCFDDGNGLADNLIARIRDNSVAVPGLLLNLQIFKGNKAISISDTISGDGEWSPFITLQAGPGVYWILVNKTDVDERHFDLEWHCNTRDGVHTGTDIGVSQFGLPKFE